MIRANSVPPEPSGTSAIGVMLRAARRPASARNVAAASWASDLDASECRVGHLQHPDRFTGGTTQQEVGVPLAAERGGGDGESEMVPRDGHRIGTETTGAGSSPAWKKSNGLLIPHRRSS